ncbi:response regulator [Rhodanobacter sp. L36]|uniref:response regulator n=1 Tax=Rhodanobacter sp. L36 TaxID=1747221 RepID=UPI0020B160FA|nr:response regulator [Rhodanobacter sp. L36]
MPHSHAQPTTIEPAHLSALHVLVADDDAASRRYLSDGLQSLGARTRACADGTDAMRLAQAETFDLLLLDVRMPGGGALEILPPLRDDPRAASSDSYAVATSAELTTSLRESLGAAGFDDVLLKPCALSDLRRILALVPAALPGAKLLDDHAALTASGDAGTMQALRMLLREELMQVERDLDSLNRDPVRFGERLHRLRSSCGFCGATSLASQVVQMERQLAHPGRSRVSLKRFREALLQTIGALHH